MLVTRSASKAKRIVCSGSRSMRWFKRAAHKKHRRRVRKDCHLAKHNPERDIRKVKRGEFVTSWDIA